MAANESEILRALRELEPSRWDEVLDFIQFLSRPRSGTRVERSRTLTARALAASDLVGLWSDRTDLGDSPAFARTLRRQAETRARD